MIVRLKHPMYDKTMELDLSPATTFGEITGILYEKGFLEKKKGGYNYTMGKHLCSIDKPLSAYVPGQAPEVLDLQVQALLTILI